MAQAEGGARGDPSSPISYELSQGEEKAPSQQGLGIAQTWETRGCANTEVLKAQQDATHWGNWFYQDGAISNKILFPPTRSHHEAPLGQSHVAVSWKIVIRDLLERRWWRNQCSEGEAAMWSFYRLPVYVWVCVFCIMEPWQRTHLGGHIGAERMDRQQKLASQPVPSSLRCLTYPISWPCCCSVE